MLHARCRTVVLAAVVLALSRAQVRKAAAFDFFGKRRTETSAGGMPNPFYWRNDVAPIVDGIRKLTVTFNTAGDKAVAAPIAAALNAVVTAWQRSTLPPDPAAGNITNTIPNGSPTIKGKTSGKIFDTQSILLHELGHALGLDHPDLGGRSPGPLAPYANSDDFMGNGNPRNFFGQPGPDGIPGTRDDVRGGNRSLVLSDLDNNPFNKPPDKIDKTTFTLDRQDGMYPNISTATVAAAPKTATGFDPIANLASPMAAYAMAGKTVRSVTWDDWAGLRYLESGLDQTAGTGDDYQFNLIFNNLGANAPDNKIPANTNILISMNPNLPEDRLGHSIPDRVGQNGIVGDRIELITDPETDEVLGMTVIWLDGPEESLGTSIVFVDVYLPVDVPEPGSLSVLGAGAMLILRRHRRPQRRHAV